MSDEQTLQIVDEGTHLSIKDASGRTVGAAQLSDSTGAFSVYVGGKAVDIEDCYTEADVLRIAGIALSQRQQAKAVRDAKARPIIKAGRATNPKYERIFGRSQRQK